MTKPLLWILRTMLFTWVILAGTVVYFVIHDVRQHEKYDTLKEDNQSLASGLHNGDARLKAGVDLHTGDVLVIVNERFEHTFSGLCHISQPF
jgi:hypothetical protein